VCDFDGCEHVAHTGNELKVHRRTHPFFKRKTTKSYPCTWEGGCSYSAALSGTLKLHLRTHPGGDKPFACEWEGCAYRAALAGTLKVHMRTHTGERPFICTWEGCHYVSD
jgi:insecticidal toxin complex protein TccC